MEEETLSPVHSDVVTSELTPDIPGEEETCSQLTPDIPGEEETDHSGAHLISTSYSKFKNFSRRLCFWDKKRLVAHSTELSFTNRHLADRGPAEGNSTLVAAVVPDGYPAEERIGDDYVLQQDVDKNKHCNGNAPVNTAQQNAVQQEATLELQGLQSSREGQAIVGVHHNLGLSELPAPMSDEEHRGESVSSYIQMEMGSNSTDDSQAQILPREQMVPRNTDFIAMRVEQQQNPAVLNVGIPQSDYVSVKAVDCLSPKSVAQSATGKEDASDMSRGHVSNSNIDLLGSAPHSSSMSSILLAPTGQARNLNSPATDPGYVSNTSPIVVDPVKLCNTSPSSSNPSSFQISSPNMDPLHGQNTLPLVSDTSPTSHGTLPSTCPAFNDNNSSAATDPPYVSNTLPSLTDHVTDPPSLILCHHSLTMSLIHHMSLILCHHSLTMSLIHHMSLILCHHSLTMSLIHHMSLILCHHSLTMSLIHHMSLILCHHSLTMSLIHHMSLILCHRSLTMSLIHHMSLILCHHSLTMSLIHHMSLILCHHSLTMSLIHHMSLILCHHSLTMLLSILKQIQ